MSSSIGQNPTFSCQQFAMSWMIGIWMEIHAVSGSNCYVVNL